MNPITLNSLTSQAASRPQALTQTNAEDVREARELKEAYSQFVGEAFYGQLLKSMRESVGEPAYFHGGSAERQFQSMLDQQMASDMAVREGTGIAEKLFEHEFPQQAKLLQESTDAQETKPLRGGLTELNALKRR